jgi:hypothetical protein
VSAPIRALERRVQTPLGHRTSGGRAFVVNGRVQPGQSEQLAAQGARNTGGICRTFVLRFVGPGSDPDDVGD